MAPRDQAKKAIKKPAVMTATAGSRANDVAATQSQDEVEIVRRATEVLGINHVSRWMQSKIPSLGNHTPYVLMQTEDGRKQVERVLLKIEHGVY